MGQPSPALQGDTFLRAPRAIASDLKPGDIGVVGVPHELTKLSRSGTFAGPQAIRQATIMTDWDGEVCGSAELGNGYIDIVQQIALSYSRTGVHDLGDVAVGPDLNLNRERIRQAVGDIRRAGALPVVLGGDHYITYPSAQGVTDRVEGPCAFLSVDMHLDLADEIPEFGRHNGATHVRRLIADGHVDPARVVIFGVESRVSREEWEFVKANDIRVIPAAEVLSRGVEATLRPALARALEGAVGLYASLDIDAGARSLVPGTGNHTGVTGLTPTQLLEIARMLSALPLVGVDLTELAPELDPSGATTGLAAAMLLEVLDPHLYKQVPFPATLR